MYDGDGERASETAGGTTTSYVYDVAGGLPAVLSDGARKYVYGQGLAYSVDGSGSVQVYHTDLLGSVRALTDGSGNLVQTYQTDAFGVPTAAQGASGQPFRFTGQQADANGLVYLRARYYDPQSGRFLSRDGYGGAVGAPLTLNRYSYVENNPLTATDPGGRCAQSQEVLQATSLCERAGWSNCASITPDMAHEMLYGNAREIDWSDLNGASSDPVDAALFTIATVTGGPELRALKAGPVVKTELHHVFPQSADLARFFARAGIDIHQYTVRLPEALHDAIHAPGDRGGAWNRAWRDFFTANPNATAKEIYAKASEMIHQFGIDGRKTVRYKR